MLTLLAQGYSNAEVSTALVLSESTVKSHVQHTLSKLGLRNRVSAAIYAHTAGITCSDERHPPADGRGRAQLRLAELAPGAADSRDSA